MVVKAKTWHLDRIVLSIIKRSYVLLLFCSSLQNPYSIKVPFFIVETLNLISFYLISPEFKYTFMPNIATTWERGGKIFETLPWEQPLVALLKYQYKNPNYFTCYPQNR